MIREVDLVSYLPPFIADFKETSETLEAENPEFKIVWEAANRVLYNEFIATADEYGISRFEKILNILPSKEDTLESRRARVQTRWFTIIPYTMKSLISKMISLCGENDFSITKEFDSYRIIVETAFELFGQVEELENLLETMIPCNIVVEAYNRITSTAGSNIFLDGAITETFSFTINTEIDDKRVINGGVSYAGYVSTHATVSIGSDTAKAEFLQGKVGYTNVISTHKEISIK
jgi:hypothetical protein